MIEISWGFNQLIVVKEHSYHHFIGDQLYSINLRFSVD